MTGADDVEINVGRIGRAHGVRGEVSVTPRTDDVDRRFAAGAVVDVAEPRPSGPRALTVQAHRWHAGRLLVRFSGIADRTAAEGLQGLLLVCRVSGDERPDDADEYYDRHLVGLRVFDASGAERGRVAEVLHLPAQDVLEIDTHRGRRLVPFVTEIVPTVDLNAGLVRLADIAGLLDDEEESDVDNSALEESALADAGEAMTLPTTLRETDDPHVARDGTGPDAHRTALPGES